MSDWLSTLEKECRETSQKATARKLGYSASTINMVLKGTYTGDMASIERAVNTKLLCSVVPCPVLGEISPQECSSNQNKPFVASSSLRCRLFRTCRECEFNTKRKEKP